MKTSNRLLMGLIVLLFAIPFIAMKDLKSKLNGNEFTRTYWDSTLNLLDGVLHTGNIKAVVLDYSGASKGDIELMHQSECKIVYSDSLRFLKRYMVTGHKIPNSGLDLSVKNDTLFVLHPSAGERSSQKNSDKEAIYFSAYNYTLNLPKNVSVTAINLPLVFAEFNNLAEHDTLNIRLKKHSSLTIDQNYIGYGANRTPAEVSDKYTMLPGLNIFCDQSSVDMKGNLHLNSLSITTTGESSLSISQHVLIDKLTGKFSDSSWVGMPNKYRKQILY